MPAGCKVTDQPMGTGITPYFFVDSVDEVNKQFHTILATSINV